MFWSDLPKSQNMIADGCGRPGSLTWAIWSLIQYFTKSQVRGQICQRSSTAGSLRLHSFTLLSSKSEVNQSVEYAYSLSRLRPLAWLCGPDALSWTTNLSAQLSKLFVSDCNTPIWICMCIRNHIRVNESMSSSWTSPSSWATTQWRVQQYWHQSSIHFLLSTGNACLLLSFPACCPCLIYYHTEKSPALQWGEWRRSFRMNWAKNTVKKDQLRSSSSKTARKATLFASDLLERNRTQRRWWKELCSSILCKMGYSSAYSSKCSSSWALWWAAHKKRVSQGIFIPPHRRHNHCISCMNLMKLLLFMLIQIGARLAELSDHYKGSLEFEATVNVSLWALPACQCSEDFCPVYSLWNARQALKIFNDWSYAGEWRQA